MFYYLCRMEMDLSKYSIDELVELRNTISNVISDYKDGYFYICNVRSYGRNWKDNWVHNPHTLQELCHQYYGDDGIVDVFSNNPDLSKIDNYGDVMFVPTEEDYEKWRSHTGLVNRIPRIEKELDEWDNRDNVPFRERPTFGPIYSREDVGQMKLELENFDMSFVAPVSVGRVYDEDEE
jgi:hypothetical protein